VFWRGKTLSIRPRRSHEDLAFTTWALDHVRHVVPLLVVSNRGADEADVGAPQHGHTVAPEGADCPRGVVGGMDGVLSIGKLATGQGDYYLQQARGRVDAIASVGSGVEDYYFDEMPSRTIVRMK
jgi:hypothetical protein